MHCDCRSLHAVCARVWLWVRRPPPYYEPRPRKFLLLFYGFHPSSCASCHHRRSRPRVVNSPCAAARSARTRRLEHAPRRRLRQVGAHQHPAPHAHEDAQQALAPPAVLDNGQWPPPADRVENSIELRRHRRHRFSACESNPCTFSSIICQHLLYRLSLITFVNI